MSNNKRKKRNIKEGTVYLVDTFAGVKVKVKATRKEKCPFTGDDFWWGVLIDEKDAKALQEKSVPYSRINIDESIIFEWQIVKSIRGKNKNAARHRKHMRKANTADSF